MGSGAAWHTQLLLSSASDAVNAGLTTAEEEEALFARLFSDSITICQLSPFNTYWTLQALGRMGKAEQALFVVRKCYGGMIELGATTFWETFAQAPVLISGDIPWMSNTTQATPHNVPWTWSGITSLAHPWSSGPAYWMSENLLGVKPRTPGFDSFEVAPLLTHSLPAVSGVVPTVHGAFAVSFDALNGDANVTVPKGAQHGSIGIPLFVGTHHDSCQRCEYAFTYTRIFTATN